MDVSKTTWSLGAVNLLTLCGLHIYIYMLVFMCVCVWEREREREWERMRESTGETNDTLCVYSYYSLEKWNTPLSYMKSISISLI